MFQLLEIRQKTPDWFATTSMDHKMEINVTDAWEMDRMQYGLFYCYGTLMGPDYKLTYFEVHQSLLQTPLRVFI